MVRRGIVLEAGMVVLAGLGIVGSIGFLLVTIVVCGWFGMLMPALLPLLQIVCEGYEKLVDGNKSEVEWLEVDTEQEPVVEPVARSPKRVSVERQAPLKKIERVVAWKDIPGGENAYPAGESTVDKFPGKRCKFEFIETPAQDDDSVDKEPRFNPKAKIGPTSSISYATFTTNSTRRLRRTASVAAGMFRCVSISSRRR